MVADAGTVVLGCRVRTVLLDVMSTPTATPVNVRVLARGIDLGGSMILLTSTLLSQTS
jgi:hypothetical protein